LAVPGKNLMDDNNKTESKIEELEQRVEEVENLWKRAVADYRNLQKRIDDEKSGWRSFANECLLQNLLPVLDNLYKAHTHIKDPGLELTVKDFKQVLKNEGVEEIVSDGETFDPVSMEAVDVVEGEKNKVIETVLTGYTLQNKLLRPARVKVGGGTTPTKGESAHEA
jgi:molecular chaperone GrpE